MTRLLGAVEFMVLNNLHRDVYTDPEVLRRSLHEWVRPAITYDVRLILTRLGQRKLVCGRRHFARGVSFYDREVWYRITDRGIEAWRQTRRFYEQSVPHFLHDQKGK